MVRFISADGSRIVEVDAKPGERVLEIAQTHDQPLEGVCEGQMACSTCHVIVAERHAALLPRPSVEEEDMLDFAWGASRHSRLACQLYTAADMPELEVRMPGAAVNMQSR
nr:2Fe-2S iron-sulfur cluster-binding protein [Sphingosinicella soli]